jgi:anti-anti-sigma factor
LSSTTAVSELAKPVVNGCPAAARWRDEMTAPGLAISTLTTGGLVVVYVRGELDVITNPRLRGRLAALVNMGARDIVIDLAEVSFLGVEAVRVLIEAHHRLAEHGGRLILSSPSRMARRLFELTGAADILGTDTTS